MASLNLTPEELKATEQTRQRLSQLSNTILSLKNDVFASNSLPSLDSLQATSDILQLNLRAILDIIAQNHDLFSRVAVHPSTNFPGRTQENILLQLLRKKAEPDVEDIMEQGRQTLGSLIMPPDAAPPPATVITSNSAISPATQAIINAQQQKEKELEDVWDAARDACGRRIYEYAVNEESDPFTLEEREMGIHNVRTGLKRKFEDRDEEEYESDDEEDDESGEAAGMSAANQGDDDVMIVDRPLPPPAPAVTTQEVEGSPVENIMRLCAMGGFHG
ncbi:mediator of RNA polymerase II transcription complex subunit 8-domain-containing protein [Biscogniauxia mediterranea]|nr:mediator of RNA polymerase II transcription complex subunit 8-domain-containing protein [Biscogniauxia mediterranea]